MPKWSYTVDLSNIFHDPDRSFTQKRDEIVKRLRESLWYNSKMLHETELQDVVTALSNSRDVEEFDEHWDYLYTLADTDRCWIATF